MLLPQAIAFAAFAALSPVTALRAMDCVKARALADQLHGDCNLADACLSFLANANSNSGAAVNSALGLQPASGLASNSGFEANNGFANSGFDANSGFANSGFDANSGFANSGFDANSGFANAGFDANSGFANAGFDANAGFANGGFEGNTGFDANSGFGGNKGFDANTGFDANAGFTSNPKDGLLEGLANWIDDVFHFFASGVQHVMHGFQDHPPPEPDHPSSVVMMIDPMEICTALVECGELAPGGGFDNCLNTREKQEECIDIWIGDGVCDPLCANAMYDWDGGDCDDTSF